ncbi:hypothetical protein [Candidatus Methanodesulfokora washburnensis]|jgi:hypothetical protein|uniref:Uncharacterized protein n=1 Tax=Candidatus Methanodesulfokora washburnensis TaxID=2478471 RepID=A0A3R9R5P4_9CREN|nr:hypothetical protein [Candidatus Methanodesulfokores washburnensis]RSN75392.1 hypothetical protein D6D85_06245 [Candidatus Methanodesulfokores washburnensis]
MCGAKTSIGGTAEGVNVRRVDMKGRIYLSRRLVGLKLYMVEVDGVVLLSASKERILSAVERLAPCSSLKEYLAILEELGELTPKEVEEFARARAWRSTEGQ